MVSYFSLKTGLRYFAKSCLHGDNHHKMIHMKCQALFLEKKYEKKVSAENPSYHISNCLVKLSLIKVFD